MDGYSIHSMSKNVFEVLPLNPYYFDIFLISRISIISYFIGFFPFLFRRENRGRYIFTVPVLSRWYSIGQIAGQTDITQNYLI